jgi:hypothetical protein
MSLSYLSLAAAKGRRLRAVSFPPPRSGGLLWPTGCVGRWLGAILGLTMAGTARGDEFERAPIHYSTAPTNNVVSRLQERLKAGQAQLTYDPRQGYLPALLKALDVPISSQTLVFTKTSMQRERIGPKTPRALYFNDDVYVGYCQNGEVLELSAVDPQLGAVFYTLEQAPAQAKLLRQTDSCLQCHGSSPSRGVPGHLLRSVYADARGLPILSFGGFRVDQTTPFAQRWGGWYVTGSHGAQKHLGNFVVKGQRAPEEIDNAAGQNLTDLSARVNLESYPASTSDLVALMVLEHQTEMHNLITKANYQARLALHEEAELNRELGRPSDYRSETTGRRLKSAGDPLVRYLLFSKEAALTEKVRGTSSFAEDFMKLGPRDGQGRSLRDLDLEKRLFKHPCSYLIYSEAFAALPGSMKDYVYQRMGDVLNGRDYSRDFDHLSTADRQAVREILLATKSDLPDSWRE